MIGSWRPLVELGVNLRGGATKKMAMTAMVNQSGPTTVRGNEPIERASRELRPRSANRRHRLSKILGDHDPAA